MTTYSSRYILDSVPGFDIPSEELNSIGTVTVTGSIDTNEVKVAGAATDVNSGATSPGTQRVVIATDQPQLTAALKVDGSGVTQPISVSGTVPVSGTVTANVGTTNGLALDATLTGGTQKTKLVDTGGTNVATVSAAGAVKTDSSATTQPVSAASLPLPAGASTSAKQPALGTAGTPSADVLTVQGVTSMTALKVDGSGVTQPVSGTITSNVGTTNGLALDATLTGGTQQTKVTDGTNIANVFKSDGTAAGQNSQMVAGSFKEISYTTTTAQALASSDVSGYRSVGVQITSQGGSSLITFQGSNDNSNWFQVSLVNSNQNATTGAQGATSATGMYYGPLSSRFFRINVTGIVSGTTAGIVELYTLPVSMISSQIAASQSGTWTVQPGNTANTTAWKVDGSAVTQPTSLTDGTNTTNILKSDGTVVGQNSQLVAGTYKEVSFTTTTAQAVATTDVSNYSWVSIHSTSNGASSTNTVQCSNDNTNWVSMVVYQGNSTSSGGGTTLNGVNVYHAPLTARYFRINVTGITSGTSAGVIEFYTLPHTLHSMGVQATSSQSGTWTVQPGNTANTTAWKVDGSAVTQPVSGTVTSNVGTTNGLALDATLTGGTAKAQTTDGTNVANVLKSDGTAAGQNSQLVAGTYKEVSFSTSIAAAVATTDVSNYTWISIHVTSQGGSATHTVQCSNDNTNWVSMLVNNSSNNFSSFAAGVSGIGVYSGPIVARYIRINVTGIVSGTSAGIIELYTAPRTPHSLGVSATSSQSGVWTVGSNSATGSTIPANAFFMGMSDAINLQPVKVAANGSNSTGVAFLATSVAAQFDDVSPTTIAENNFGNVRMSANRNVYETIRDAAGNERGANVTAANALVVDGSAVTQPVSLAAGTTGGYSFNNITTATTITVKSGAGTLHSIVTNTTAASATVTIYDNTAGSGTKIGTTTNPISLLQMGPLTAIYDVAFATGLTIVTTGAQDITVTYK